MEKRLALLLVTVGAFAAGACTTDPETTSPPDDAGADVATPTDDGGLQCNPPVNGNITATGEFKATLTKGDANLDMPAPSTIPCEATFRAGAGVSLGGGAYTGALSIQCTGGQGELYYGFITQSYIKPKAGDSYPTSLFATTTETYIEYEEGPRCDSKYDKAKTWANKTGGALVIDTINGAQITFHITDTGFEPETATASNFKGTGSFTLSGSGSVTVKDL